MEITLDNRNAALDSANRHVAFAQAQRLIGNKKTARKHEKYAQAVYREAMALEPVSTEDAAMTTDELYAALMDFA